MGVRGLSCEGPWERVEDVGNDGLESAGELEEAVSLCPAGAGAAVAEDEFGFSGDCDDPEGPASAGVVSDAAVAGAGAVEEPVQDMFSCQLVLARVVGSVVCRTSSGLLKI